MYLHLRDVDNSNCYQDGFTDRWYCNSSAWDDWIRWVVLAVVIVAFFLLFVLCSCITARRRRRAGQQPFYGTGWASRPGQNAQPYYHQQPAPPYSATAPPDSHGYYGNPNNPPHYAQQPGYELQSPTPAYGNSQQYAPPPGPPPSHQKDGVIR